jgi:hypothetical protein
MAALVGLGQLAACTTDEDDPGADADADASTGGSAGGSATGAAGDAGNTGTGTGGSSTPGNTVCANPIVLASASPGIADFDAYEEGADISSWSFALGGDSSTGIYSGPFVYGDEPDGNPETYGMVAGHDSTYALGIADTLAEEYGGGMGLWMSDCLDATAFSGISFWVRGSAPTGKVKISLMMEETTSVTPATGDSNVGTCPGTDETCIHPSFEFDVSADGSWARVELAWNRFQGGNAAGTSVPADGHNIWQIQFDIGVTWEDGGDGAYVPVPAAYELVVDDLTFY